MTGWADAQPAETFAQQDEVVVHPEAVAGHPLQHHRVNDEAEGLNSIVVEAGVAVTVGLEDPKRQIERAGPAAVPGLENYRARVEAALEASRNS
jgi:hypothetical protein